MEHERVAGGSGVDPVGTPGDANPGPARIEVGHYSLAADLLGDPGLPPVILLHGIPGWRGTWRPVARLLATRAHVVAPDLAGFGESSAAPAEFHAADHARLIVGLIRTLGLRRVHLVGFDFGGPTAVMVCAQAPEVVATLTLGATNVLTDTGIPLPLQLVRPPVVGDLFSRLLFGRTGLTMMWFAAVARRDRFRLADYRAMLRFPQGVTSTRRLFQASLRDLPGLYGPVHAALGGIQVPCAVVWGDRDPFFPTAVGERTAAQIPGARFVQLKGCGHFLPAEDPGGFARVVEELVSGSTVTNCQIPGGTGDGSIAREPRTRGGHARDAHVR
jgi:pimeloyl-ACP methyl ester carboxylesterase